MIDDCAVDHGDPKTKTVDLLVKIIPLIKEPARRGGVTYTRIPSMIIAKKLAVLDWLLSTAEMTSRTKITVQIPDLTTFMIRKVRGLSLCFARRTISVMVRLRSSTHTPIQIGIVLSTKN
jgi:hypothetical protein